MNDYRPYSSTREIISTGTHSSHACNDVVAAIHGQASSKPNCQEASRGQVPLNSSILVRYFIRACAKTPKPATAATRAADIYQSTA
ncbi:hypothetical protein KQX54_001685 [Cotesia glomerata]|uniref:Uncharacterized protein n=1 Tax=Cotesia glomerata TaxID=32391 RepID=A0AAV7ILB7_COTGL|nr:hypothetical protein KQX54_001685 [Cotesia glomerata]